MEVRNIFFSTDAVVLHTYRAKHWKIPNFLYLISRYYPIFHLS